MAVEYQATNCSSVDQISADVSTKYRRIHGRVSVDTLINMLTDTWVIVLIGALSTHDPWMFLFPYFCILYSESETNVCNL